ncbi:MAG: TIGR00282 family metallophosphoesterase [Candidatus Rifleibacteriota bacterium]
MKILLIGDIYGKTGREAIKKFLPILKQQFEPDWIVANGENTTAGNGISAKHLKLLKQCGIDIVTSGNHLFARKDWSEVVKDAWLLRPENLADLNAPGTGLRIFKNPASGKNELAVMNLAGRVFMQRARCPFKTAESLLALINEDVPIIVDFHSEATSEKQAMFWFLDGRVSAVVGTHTHVQTSDERVLPRGTAVITDLGMTGALNSILGVDTNTIVGRFVNGYSDKFVCGSGQKKIEGIFLKIESDNKVEHIERFRLQE